MNVSMNVQIVTELWPRTEVPRIVAIPGLEASSLSRCIPFCLPAEAQLFIVSESYPHDWRDTHRSMLDCKVLQLEGNTEGPNHGIAFHGVCMLRLANRITQSLTIYTTQIDVLNA